MLMAMFLAFAVTFQGANGADCKKPTGSWLHKCQMIAEPSLPCKDRGSCLPEERNGDQCYIKVQCIEDFEKSEALQEIEYTWPKNETPKLEVRNGELMAMENINP